MADQLIVDILGKVNPDFKKLLDTVTSIQSKSINVDIRLGQAGQIDKILTNLTTKVKDLTSKTYTLNLDFALPRGGVQRVASDFERQFKNVAVEVNNVIKDINLNLNKTIDTAKSIGLTSQTSKSLQMPGSPLLRSYGKITGGWSNPPNPPGGFGPPSPGSAFFGSQPRESGNMALVRERNVYRALGLPTPEQLQQVTAQQMTKAEERVVSRLVGGGGVNITARGIDLGTAKAAEKRGAARIPWYMGRYKRGEETAGDILRAISDIPAVGQVGEYKKLTLAGKVQDIETARQRKIEKDAQAHNDALFRINQRANLKITEEDKEVSDVARRANLYNPLERLFFGPKKAAEKLGSERGFNTRQTAALQKELEGQKLFDFGRLASQEAMTQLGFSFLFGGFRGLTGATVGGAAGGPSGVFIGSAISQKLGAGLDNVLEGLKVSFLETAKAGLEFQRSILQISAVFQSVSTVLGSSGKPLPIEQQMAFQQKRAEDLQKSVFPALARLGIGGERAAGITSAVSEALSRRGIFATPEQSAIITSRVGAEAQLYGPGLPLPKLRQEIINMLTGGRTTGEVSLPFIQQAPRVKGGFSSAEQLIKFTDALGRLTDTLQKSPNFATAFNRFQSFFETIKTFAGAAFVDKLTPGFDALTKILTNSKVQTSIISIAESLGKMGSEFLKLAADILPKVTKGIDDFIIKMDSLAKGFGSSFVIELSKALGASAGLIAGGILGALLGLITGGPGGAALGARLGGAAGLAGGGFLGYLFGKGSTITSKEETKSIKGGLQTLLQTSLNQIFEKGEGEGGVGDALQEFYGAVGASPFYSRLKIAAARQAILERPGEAALGESYQVPLAIQQTEINNKILELQKKTLDLQSFEGQIQSGKGLIGTSEKNIGILQEALTKKTAEVEKTESGSVEERRGKAAVDLITNLIEQEKQARTTGIRDLIKTGQERRNLEERVSDTLKDEILQRNELTRSLAANQRAIESFREGLESTFKSEELQYLEKQREIAKAGGTPDTSIDLSDENYKRKQLESLQAQSNVLAKRLGFQENQTDLGAYPQASRTTSPLGQEQEEKFQSLTDSFSKTKDELENRLPRALRDSREALDLFTGKLQEVADRLYSWINKEMSFDNIKNPKDTESVIRTGKKSFSIGISTHRNLAEEIIDRETKKLREKDPLLDPWESDLPLEFIPISKDKDISDIIDKQKQSSSLIDLFKDKKPLPEGDFRINGLPQTLQREDILGSKIIEENNGIIDNGLITSNTENSKIEKTDMKDLTVAITALLTTLNSNNQQLIRSLDLS